MFKVQSLIKSEMSRNYLTKSFQNSLFQSLISKNAKVPKFLDLNCPWLPPSLNLTKLRSRTQTFVHMVLAMASVRLAAVSLYFRIYSTIRGQYQRESAGYVKAIEVNCEFCFNVRWRTENSYLFQVNNQFFFCIRSALVNYYKSK